MKPERIPIPLVDIESQKILERIDGYIDLNPKTFIRKIKFLAKTADDEKDLAGTWHEGWIDNITVIQRERVACVDMSLTKEQTWRISIEATGMAEDIHWYYKSREGAERVFNKLLTYFFPDDYPCDTQPGTPGQEGTTR